MHLKSITKTILLVSWVALGLTMIGCQSAPKTNIEKIDSMKKQLEANAKLLNEIETKDFVTLEKDFKFCDSMLQYQNEEQVEKAFETLRLVQAYIEQFKSTKPMMQAEIDSSLLQLDRLKADAESHYLSDSLVTVYIEEETEYVNRLNNQVHYFQDRFGTCQNDLKAMKKQK